jgi:hypothetical protein
VAGAEVTTLVDPEDSEASGGLADLEADTRRLFVFFGLSLSVIVLS